jgi:hypothetical protein
MYSTVKPVFTTSTKKQPPENNDQPEPRPKKNITNFIEGTSEKLPLMNNDGFFRVLKDDQCLTVSD